MTHTPAESLVRAVWERSIPAPPRLSTGELEEVITDAWAARAPKRLVEAFFDEA
ncbi:hypothetical protein ABEG17_08945 [Pedococcus sp. KACC 23699]|uniref:Uncharacterized protein n=1 Tax=Pedococcus sp. KACC 23699 TaxID=3149228 RepID=A0AAU7JZ46_9MICO